MTTTSPVALLTVIVFFVLVLLRIEHPDADMARIAVVKMQAVCFIYIEFCYLFYII